MKEEEEKKTIERLEPVQPKKKEQKAALVFYLAATGVLCSGNVSPLSHDHQTPTCPPQSHAALVLMNASVAHLAATQHMAVFPLSPIFTSQHEMC